MPSDWRIETLGNCVDILDSQRIPLNNEERENRIQGKALSELYPYYGATQQVGYIDDYLFDEELILLGEDGVLFYDRDKTKAYIASGKFWVNNHAHVLRAKNGNLNRFINYYLNIFDYHGYVNGATRLKLTQSNMKEIPIPLPPLPQQEKIVSVLDTASALVEKQKTLLEQYDLFLKSKFIEMFGDPVKNPMGWEVVKLKDLTSKIGSGATPKGGKEAYHNEGISLIRSLNVHDNQFLYKDLAFIDDKQADGLSNVVVEQNDVLLNITGASVCRTTIVPDNVLPARVNQHVAIIRPKLGILNSGYLLHLFLSNYKQHLIHLATSGGATREALTKADIEELDILLPPFELQNNFAQIVKQTEILKQKEQQKLEKLQTLYDMLMSRAFKGEIE